MTKKISIIVFSILIAVMLAMLGTFGYLLFKNKEIDYIINKSSDIIAEEELGGEEILFDIYTFHVPVRGDFDHTYYDFYPIPKIVNYSNADKAKEFDEFIREKLSLFSYRLANSDNLRLEGSSLYRENVSYDDILSIREEFYENEDRDWGDEYVINNVYFQNDIVSMSIDIFVSGGARPAHGIEIINYDLINEEEIELGDIMHNRYIAYDKIKEKLLEELDSMSDELIPPVYNKGTVPCDNDDLVILGFNFNEDGLSLIIRGHRLNVYFCQQYDKFEFSFEQIRRALLDNELVSRLTDISVGEEAVDYEEELIGCAKFLSGCGETGESVCGPCGCKKCCSGFVSAQGNRPFNGGEEGIICDYFGHISHICINCGDGICSDIENWCMCPEDCTEPNIETLEDHGAPIL